MTNSSVDLAKRMAAEWKLCGHLFLALEKAGLSAGWLLRENAENLEVFQIYEEARIAVQVSQAVPEDCATDMEVALLFYFWPAKHATIASGINAVSTVWKTTRELTLKSWLRRLKFDGPSGPITLAVEELREGRRYLIADMQESLWMTDPGLAARIQIANTTPPKTRDLIEAQVVSSGVPRGISDGSLMKGIQ